jgi:hypothetical protein
MSWTSSWVTFALRFLPPGRRQRPVIRANLAYQVARRKCLQRVLHPTAPRVHRPQHGNVMRMVAVVVLACQRVQVGEHRPYPQAAPVPLLP